MKTKKDLNLYKPMKQQTVENKNTIVEEIVKKLTAQHKDTDRKLYELSKLCSTKGK